MEVRKILEIIENLFFPSVCEGCGKVGSYLCDRCAKKKIQLIIKQKCHVCKKDTKSRMVHPKCKNSTYLDGVFVIARYSKFIESYVGDIKYEFYFAMISDLAKVMNKALEKNQKFREIVGNAVFTFAPLYPLRRRWRGFNQAEKIAGLLAKYWNKECVKLLKRVKKTKSQVGLKRKQRLRNLRGAFEFMGDKGFLEKNIIIVDDVMTSGGTLEECARTLKEAGARKVYGLVFARG